MLCAQAQGMYWFLVLHSRFNAMRGQLEALRGRRIGAAPWVESGLRRLLQAAGMPAESNAIHIAPVPKTEGIGTNFGLAAAMALERGQIDGFWANGMAAAIAEQSGSGTVVLDVRRGDGPDGCFDYTFASIAVTRHFLDGYPDACEAAVRAIVKAHAALRSDISLATDIGRKRFPDVQARLIASIIERDLSFYHASIPARAIEGMSRFAIDMGLAERHISYKSIVAVEMKDLWRDGQRPA